MKFVYAMWFVVLCDPQWWVRDFAGTAVLKLPTILFGLMLILIIFKPPRAWFPPFLVFILYTIAVIPFAYNRGNSYVVVKELIAFYVLAIGTLAFVRNPHQAVPIVTGWFLGQFAWWVGLGVIHGRIKWHPTLANYDGYGPLMDIGIGAAYYYALATTNKRERWIAIAICIGCVVGLVSSFARGAVLGGAAVLIWIWLRSKRKGAATLAVLGGVAVVAIAGVLFTGAKRGNMEKPNFFAEMGTIGSGDGTQTDRDVLWAMARRVWREHPVLGVGAENFGPYAAETFAVGTTGGLAYDANPGRLYDKKLHSTFFQILCEYGTVGSLIFVWMLVDFWRLNMKLRRKPYVDQWRAISGGRLGLSQLSLGLECAMVGYLASGLFYNQIFNVHWLFTLLTINALLYYISKPVAVARRPRLVPQPA